MGTYITAFAETRQPDGSYSLSDTIELEVFNKQDYARFGWLANVRNYSGVPPIAEGQQGFLRVWGWQQFARNLVDALFHYKEQL